MPWVRTSRRTWRSPKAIRTAVGFPDVAFVFTWYCPGKRRPGRVRFAPTRPCVPGGGLPVRALSKFRQGALDESLAQVRRAGALWRNRPDTEWHWTFRLLEAEILLEQAELSRAQSLLETDLEGCRKYARAEIRRRVLLAKLCLRRGGPDSGRAGPLLEEARAMAGGEAAAGLRAEIDVARGMLQVCRNDFDSAERTWRQAQQAAQSAGDEYQYAAATNNLGMVQQRRSRCDESIAYFDQALQVWRKLGADQVIAATANNLGLCYADLGNFDKALEYRQEALRLVKPGPRLSEVLGETGRLYLHPEPSPATPSLTFERRWMRPSASTRLPKVRDGQITSP